MKTLYININGEDIQSTEDIIVTGRPEDAIINKFFFELGKEILKGVVAPGVTSIKKKNIVTDFKAHDERVFDSILEQWDTLKQELLGEKPTGSRTIKFPDGYISWLQNSSQPAYAEIAKSLYKRGGSVEVSLDKIYKNAIGIIVNNIEPEECKDCGKFVVNDIIVTDDSKISSDINKVHSNGIFFPYEDWIKGETKKDDNKDLFVFDCIFGFSEGLSLVCVNEKYGYIDVLGKLTIPLEYDFAGWFANNLAPVCKNGKYGYIDKGNNLIIPFQFDKAMDFSEGLAAVKKENQWFFIDTNGEVRFFINDINNSDMSVLSFYNGFACVRNSIGKWGAVDKNGKEKVPFKYDFPFWIDEIGVFSVAISYPGNWGVRNIYGGSIIQAGYSRIDPYSEGLAACRKKKLWGFIDRKGLKRIDSIYEEAKCFSEDLAVIKKDGKWGAIDKIGSLIVPNSFDDMNSFKEGLAPVCQNGKWGFIDRTRIRIQCIFDWVERFNDGLARVQYKGKECIINKNGELVIHNGIVNFEE